jgi:cell wall-associated NlpC family hydrolase
MPILDRLLLPLRARLFAALAVFLTQPVKRSSQPPTADPASLLAVFRNGDVLLTDGNTRAAALVKRLTKSSWSHVSMYVGPLEAGPDPRCIVEADIAEGVRAIRFSELDVLAVRVLRPIGLDDAQRARLAEWVVTRIGGEYDLRHAWVLARTFLPAPPKASLPPAPSGIAQSASRYICSTLLADAFALVGHEIPSLRTAVAAHGGANPRYVIPSDFESASGFEVVAPLASVPG